MTRRDLRDVYPFGEHKTLDGAAQRAIAEHREAGFRRGLALAPFTPQSIELIVKKNRDWLDGKQQES